MICIVFHEQPCSSKARTFLYLLLTTREFCAPRMNTGASTILRGLVALIFARHCQLNKKIFFFPYLLQKKNCVKLELPAAGKNNVSLEHYNKQSELGDEENHRVRWKFKVGRERPAYSAAFPLILCGMDTMQIGIVARTSDWAHTLATTQHFFLFLSFPLTHRINASWPK